MTKSRLFKEDADILSCLDMISHELSLELAHGDAHYFHVESSGRIHLYDHSELPIPSSTKFLEIFNTIVLEGHLADDINAPYVALFERAVCEIFGVGMFHQIRNKNTILFSHDTPNSFAKLVDTTNNGHCFMFEMPMLENFENANIWTSFWNGRNRWPKTWNQDYQKSCINFLDMHDIERPLNELCYEIFNKSEVALLLIKHEYYRNLGLTQQGLSTSMSSVIGALHQLVTSHIDRCKLIQANVPDVHIDSPKITIAL